MIEEHDKSDMLQAQVDYTCEYLQQDSSTQPSSFESDKYIAATHTPPIYTTDTPDPITENYTPDQVIERILKLNIPSVTPIDICTSSFYAHEAENHRILFKKSNAPIFYLCPPKNKWECIYNMPYGYEVSFNRNGKIYFIDHVNRTTANVLPSESKEESSHVDEVEPPQVKEEFETLNFEIFVPKKIKDHGLTINKVTSGFMIDKISRKSIFYQDFLIGDIIQTIDNIVIQTQEDFQSSLKPKAYISVKINRKIKKSQRSLINNKVLKPALRSEERAKYLKQIPLRVHFSEAPIIFKYQQNLPSEVWGETKFAESFYDIIKVNIPDGTFRTQKYGKEQVISSFTESMMKSMSILHSHCFTLAILPRGSTDIDFYSPDDLVSTVNQRKKSQGHVECFLVMYTFPKNVNVFSDPKYSKLVDFMFQQFRLFMLTARSRNILHISKNDIHQLIAFSATLDFLSAKISTQITEYAVSGKDNKESTILKKKPPIRLSTINIEEHQVFTPLTTINDLRRDLEIYAIRSLMINAFELFVPDDLKIFFLIGVGGPLITREEHEKVLLRFPTILQNAQLCFIKACIECRINPVARYRVWVQTYMNGKSPPNKKSGVPETLSISFNTLEFHRGNATEFIILTKDISAVVSSEIDDSFSTVSVFSKENAVMTVKVQKHQCKSLVLMISANCNELWNENFQINVPVIDISHHAFRCDPDEIPKYDDIHILMPSTWNYNGCPSAFYRALQDVNTSNGDCILELHRFFVIYSKANDKNSLKLPLDSKSKINIHHIDLQPFSTRFKKVLKKMPSMLSLDSEPTDDDLNLNDKRLSSIDSKSEDDDVYLSDLSKKVQSVIENEDIKSSLKKI